MTHLIPRTVQCRFQEDGTHYFWLRGYCQGSDNTAHVGLNGNASASSAKINLPVTKDWVWSGTIAAGSRAKISVSKTGLQTVEVYMREDGLVLDKILITSSSAYTPSDSEHQKVSANNQSQQRRQSLTIKASRINSGAQIIDLGSLFWSR